MLACAFGLRSLGQAQGQAPTFIFDATFQTWPAPSFYQCHKFTGEFADVGMFEYPCTNCSEYGFVQWDLDAGHAQIAADISVYYRKTPYYAGGFAAQFGSVCLGGSGCGSCYDPPEIKVYVNRPAGTVCRLTCDKSRYLSLLHPKTYAAATSGGYQYGPLDLWTHWPTVTSQKISTGSYSFAQFPGQEYSLIWAPDGGLAPWLAYQVILGGQSTATAIDSLARHVSKVSFEVLEGLSPNAEIQAPDKADLGAPVQLYALANDPDDCAVPGSGCGIIWYEWSIEDGDVTTKKSGPTPTMTWLTPGTYDIELTVTDNEGARASASRTICVAECCELTQLKIPVTAAVIPKGGGTASNVQIGELRAEALGGNAVGAYFEFDTDYSYLDNCYDFRWINVVRSESSGGEPQPVVPIIGALPGIDPPVGSSGDYLPFYHGQAEWELGSYLGTPIRKEGAFSLFVDSPNGIDKAVVFHTYLVATDSAEGALSPQTVMVLAGFSWRFSNPTFEPLAGESRLCGPLAASPETVNLALANGTNFCPGHDGCPGFPGFVASAAAPLGPCLPLTGSPPSIGLASGGTQFLYVDGSALNAGAQYLVLGTTAGTAPGLALGPFTLPIQPDPAPGGYFWRTLLTPNTPPLLSSLGVLDVDGRATAAFSLPPLQHTALSGTVLHHAVLGFKSVPTFSIAFISEAVPLLLGP
jgi:PKD domain